MTALLSPTQANALVQIGRAGIQDAWPDPIRRRTGEVLLRLGVARLWITMVERQERRVDALGLSPFGKIVWSFSTDWSLTPAGLDLLDRLERDSR